MFIIIPEFDEEQVENTIARFRTIIERTGGEAGEVHNWGRRKLAYEIDHRTDGFVKLPPTYTHKPLPEPVEVSC